MNRQQRRAEQRQQAKQPSTLWASPRITTRDLEKAYRDGAEECRVMLAESLIRQIYAAVAMAAWDVFGFRKRRLKRLLRAIDDILTMGAINSDEAIEAAWQKTGLHLEFGKLERVQENEKAS